MNNIPNINISDSIIEKTKDIPDFTTTLKHKIKACNKRFMIAGSIIQNKIYVAY